MEAIDCGATRRWLQRLDVVPSHATLSEHVFACATCRGALLLTLAELLDVAPPTQPLRCVDCAEELPAYLDLVRVAGDEAAATRYPHIWWHLWLCPACAEVARLTDVLLDATQAGTMALVPQLAPQQVGPPALALCLKRSFMRAALAPQLALGAAWGDNGFEPLSEHSLAAYQLKLHVQMRDATAWDIALTIVPPTEGCAVISFGATVFRAPFDRFGEAIVSAIPFALLADRSGPDMVVTIEA